ncbi:8368_t:CDS:2, partial [Gigaspora rosea]
WFALNFPTTDMEIIKTNLKNSNIKELNYSIFNAQKKIGSSKFSIVYSAIFNGETYALKSFSHNLYLDKNKLKQINRKHPKNIFGKPLIADFGDFRTTNDMAAYVDPHYSCGKEVERNKQSDIYSLGVLLWELTKEIIPGTPQEYVDIYKNCWSPEPEKRPKLNDILSNLDRLSAETSVEFIINKIKSN